MPQHSNPSQLLRRRPLTPCGTSVGTSVGALAGASVGTLVGASVAATLAILENMMSKIGGLRRPEAVGHKTVPIAAEKAKRMFESRLLQAAVAVMCR